MTSDIQKECKLWNENCCRSKGQWLPHPKRRPFQTLVKYPPYIVTPPHHLSQGSLTPWQAEQTHTSDAATTEEGNGKYERLLSFLPVSCLSASRYGGPLKPETASSSGLCFLAERSILHWFKNSQLKGEASAGLLSVYVVDAHTTHSVHTGNQWCWFK